ncbi:MAG: hypothetical protein KDA53_04325 [Hyphomonas sp.]|nr:hypothetical protein [Hyphomonas sp.]
MILQRLTASLRKQDWFTVLIETLIVVLGVFLGLQANNWNEARKDRIVERQTLDRLRVEVPALMASRARVLEFSTARKDALEGAAAKVFAADSPDPLTQFECLAITLSHIYTLPPDTSPMIEELVSTSRTATLGDARVRAALAEFLLARDDSRTVQRAVSIDIHQLSLEFPDLMKSVYQPASGGAPGSARTSCDLAGMRENGRFGNTLVSNQQRFLNYYDTGIVEVDARLGRLADALNIESPPKATP